MPYFMLTTDADGDVYFAQVTSEEVLNELHEESEDGYFAPGQSGTPFLSAVPNIALSSWRPSRLLIKGEIVVPKPKEVVTRYTLDD